MQQIGRELALALLLHDSAERRLEAARALQLVGEPRDEIALRRALAAESVSWVRLAITEAIEHLDELEVSDLPEVSPVDTDWNTVSTVTREVIHELSHIVARMRLALDDPPTNAVPAMRLECDRLANFLEALKILHIATGEYKADEFDLAALLLNVAEGQSREFGANIDLLGLSPCVVVGSKVLIEAIAQNGLRNAVEANVAAGRKLAPIVVSWARSPRESWLSILDDGIGPLRRTTNLFRMGATTKPGHAGMGLAICAQAARRLRGTVLLRPGSAGGGHFELRWPSVSP